MQQVNMSLRTRSLSFELLVRGTCVFYIKCEVTGTQFFECMHVFYMQQMESTRKQQRHPSISLSYNGYLLDMFYDPQIFVQHTVKTGVPMV